MIDKPVIAITMGDPCGIGPEVVAKALSNKDVYASCRPIVIGNMFANIFETIIGNNNANNFEIMIGNHVLQTFVRL